MSAVKQQHTRKCDECEGGRWYDASHGCSRKCKKCKGTGVVTTPDQSIAQNTALYKQQRNELLAFVEAVVENQFYDHPLIEGDETTALKETLRLIEANARAVLSRVRGEQP